MDDGRRDVGCQPGKTQEGVEVGCRHLLFLCDVMHAQRRALDQAGLDVVRPANHGMNALIEPLVFGLMALDRLLVLAPFVRMAGVQRLAHPFEHLYQ